MSVPVHRKKLSPYELEWNDHWERMTDAERERITKLGGGKFVLVGPSKKKPKKTKKVSRAASGALTPEQCMRCSGKKHSVRALFSKLRGKLKKR